MGRVEVYFNLRKKLFSVRQGGRVISHEPCVLIREPRFVVQEGGRKRVLKEKRKNVHAFVVADHSGAAIVPPYGVAVDKSRPLLPVRYNPYIHRSFVVDRTDRRVRLVGAGRRDPWVVPERPIEDAEFVIMRVKRGRPEMFARLNDYSLSHVDECDVQVVGVDDLS